MKKIVSLFVFVVLVFVFSVPSYAYTSGFAGISEYGNCPFGNRAGAHYVENLKSTIASICTNSFILKNANANKYVFQASWAESVDFFAFSGHGESKASYNTLHFRSVGNQATDHSSHSNSADYALMNASNNEVKLKGTLKYATFYSCNFLTNGGTTTKQQAIYSMFEGGRLAMGFASQMYLDSREGTRYGNNLKSGTYSIKNAFFEATQYYQVQRQNGDSIARVVGYTSAANDKLTNTYSAISSSYWHSNYASGYSIIDTQTIPHTGNTI
jgi:hypothetical protein